MTHDFSSWFREQLVAGNIPTIVAERHYPEDIPCFDIPSEQWNDMAKLAKQQSLRLVAEWAADEHAMQFSGFSLYAAFAHRDHGYGLVRTMITEDSSEFPSIVNHYPAASRMERTIHDFFGLVPMGHPDLRNWIKHEHWPEDTQPLRKDFNADSTLPRVQGRYPFIEAEGEGVYQIPVGPVHAGIIEPGHFRFLAVGENILNMEERLGYVHKGIEKRMEGRDVYAASRLAARISGDATVAHSWAFCQAAEYAAHLTVPARATTLRAVLCERERMANHIGDIGTICNDAAWTFMHMQCQRLREDMARQHRNIFGHRLMMDLVVPGGFKTDISTEDVLKLIEQTRAVTAEVKRLHEIYQDHTPIRERVVDSGRINKDDAVELGLLGYTGRSINMDLDARRDAAYAPFADMQVKIPVCNGGDVAARLWVRFEEIVESAWLIEDLLTTLPEGPTQVEWKQPTLGNSGFAVVESWRGEIATWVRFGEDDLLDRCYVRDPSMINWLALELAVRDIPVPDFPLNNKSFNCSYSGHDM